MVAFGMPERPLILVVEDNEDIRLLMVDFLQDCEYRVASANERGLGEDVLRTTYPSLVIADVNLRGQNGDSLAQVARTLGVPVLLISGEPQAIERHMDAGTHFMQKPFRLADLRAKVKELIAMDC